MSIQASDVIDAVRQRIQDTDATDYRVSDAAMLIHLAAAERELLGMRPDLLLDGNGNMVYEIDTLPAISATTDYLLTPSRYRYNLANWVAAMCLSDDSSDMKNLEMAGVLFAQAKRG